MVSLVSEFETQFCLTCGEPTRQTLQGRNYKFCNAECADEYHSHGAVKKNRQLWTKHRIRYSEFIRMLESQGWKCAACGGELKEAFGGFGAGRGMSSSVRMQDRSPHIDHLHGCSHQENAPQTQISCSSCRRGILCGPCNVALGHALEDQQRLRALADYIKKFEKGLTVCRNKVY